MPVELDCFLDCPSCGRVQPADRPECIDGHGPDCPEWVCAVCLTAVLIDPVLVDPELVSLAAGRGAGRRSVA